MSRAYYNEFDPRAAAWLRELIAAGLIAPGDVDERSIADVTASDLAGYAQCHFFAGIGGWSYALRLAGWPDGLAVWTGSCPCQPFSVAGRGLGTKDPRHLWPQFRRLIRKCRPAIVFGEQVASKDGRGWLAGVFTDLEKLDYAVAGADLCAAGVSAPHIRQRLYWVGNALRGRQLDNEPWRAGDEYPAAGDGVDRVGNTAHNHERRYSLSRTYGERQPAGRSSGAHRLGESDRAGRDTGRETSQAAGHGRSPLAASGAGRMEHPALGGFGTDGGAPGKPGHPEQSGEIGGLANMRREGLAGWQEQSAREECATVERSGYARGLADAERPGWWADEQERGAERRAAVRRAMPWDDYDIAARHEPKRGTVLCRVPTEPLFFPLADGFSGSRVGLLRGSGNAIVPEVAAAFIEAYREARGE